MLKCSENRAQEQKNHGLTKLSKDYLLNVTCNGHQIQQNPIIPKLKLDNIL